MSDDKAHEGRPKTDRRTWDKEAYAKKALERLAAIEAGENPDKVDDSDVGIFREAPADLPRVPGSQRAFLQTREKGVDFESKIGVRQIAAPEGTDVVKAGGYYCPVCECTLKDSASYLDHINGKRHQRRLGFSMRVEHSTLDQVKNRLEMHKLKRQREQQASGDPHQEALAAWEAKMKRLAEEEEERKRTKKENKRAKREDAKGSEGGGSSGGGDVDATIKGDSVGEGGVKGEGAGGGEAAVNEEEDMMAMMGFSGFSTTKKK